MNWIAWFQSWHYGGLMNLGVINACEWTRLIQAMGRHPDYAEALIRAIMFEDRRHWWFRDRKTVRDQITQFMTDPDTWAMQNVL